MGSRFVLDTYEDEYGEEKAPRSRFVLDTYEDEYGEEKAPRSRFVLDTYKEPSPSKRRPSIPQEDVPSRRFLLDSLSEMVRPEGGAAGAFKRTLVGVPLGVEKTLRGIQDLIGDPNPTTVANIEYLEKLRGKPDFYSGLGEFIPDAALIATGEGALAKIPGLAAKGAPLVTRMLKGAARSGALGAGYEAVKEGDIRAAPGGALAWGAFGAASPVAGAGAKKLAQKIRLEDRLSRATSMWWSQAEVIRKKLPDEYWKWKRLKGAQRANELEAEKMARTVHEPIKTMVKAEKQGDVAKLLEKVFRTRQTVDLVERGKGWVPTGEKSLIAKTDARLKALDPDEFKAVEEGYTRLRDADDALLESGRDVLGDDALAAFRRLNPNHAPLQRVFLADEIKRLEEEGKTGAARALRKRVGSEREIDDTVVNLFKNQIGLRTYFEKQRTTHSIISAIAKDPELGKFIKVRSLVQPVKGLKKKIKGIVEEAGVQDREKEILSASYKYLREPTGLKKNEVASQFGGKWSVTEFDLRTVQGQNLFDIFRNVSTPEGWGKVIATMKNYKRAGITLAPEFTVRNLWRDTMMSLIIDPNVKVWNLPVEIAKMPIDYMRAVGEITGNKKFIQALGSEGALFSEYHRGTLRPTGQSSAAIRNKINMLGLKKTPTFVFKGMEKNPLHYLEAFARVIEQVPRLRMAEREVISRMGKKAGREAIKSGKFDKEVIEAAANIFREGTADFAEMGWRAAEWGQYIPFFTAGIAGTRTIWRAMEKDPSGTVGKIFALVTVPAVTLWQMNHNEDWYKALSPAEKNLYFHITPYIRIPKPFEAGMFGASVFERILDGIANEDPQMAEGIVNAIKAGFPSDPIPAGIGTAWGLATNKDPFFKSPIVPKSLEGLPKYLQSKPSTSAPAKAVGKAIGVSPAQVDWVVSDLFGGLGREAMRQTTGVARALSPGKEVVPAKDLADLPGLRAIFKKHPEETTYSGNINRFYDNFQRTQKTHREVKTLIKDGKREDAVRVMKEKKRDYLFYSYFNKVGGSIRKLMARYREIYDSEKHTYMTREQKRETLAKIARQINKITAAANKKYEGYDGK